MRMRQWVLVTSRGGSMFKGSKDRKQGVLSEVEVHLLVRCRGWDGGVWEEPGPSWGGQVQPKSKGSHSTALTRGGVRATVSRKTWGRREPGQLAATPTQSRHEICRV